VRTQPRHRQPFAHLTLALVVVDVAAVGGIIVTWMVTSGADSPPHAAPPAPTASNSPSAAPDRPLPVRPGPSSSGSSAPSAGISSSDDERARINATTHTRSRGLPRSTPTTVHRPSVVRLDAASAAGALRRHQGKSVPAAGTALDAGPVLALLAPGGSVAPSAPAVSADQGSKPAPRPESPPARRSPTVPPLTTVQDTDRAPRSAGAARPACSSASHARCPVDPDAAGATWSMPLTLQHTEPRNSEPAPAEAWTAGVDGIKDDAPHRARRGVVPYDLDHQEGHHRRRGLL